MMGAAQNVYQGVKCVLPPQDGSSVVLVGDQILTGADELCRRATHKGASGFGIGDTVTPQPKRTSQRNVSVAGSSAEVPVDAECKLQC